MPGARLGLLPEAAAEPSRNTAGAVSGRATPGSRRMLLLSDLTALYLTRFPGQKTADRSVHAVCSVSESHSCKPAVLV